jgi:hypothetical protein
VSIKEDIIEQYFDEPLMFADGFDDAIKGVVTIFNKVHVCYDYVLCLAILCADGMTPEEAVEFFDFNIAGAYGGDYTPAFFYHPMSSDIEDEGE